MDLSSYEAVRRTRVLAYGPPKSGKTSLVAQLAKAGFTCHLLDLEHGVKTLMNPALLPVEFRKNVKFYNIPDTVANPIAIATVRRLFKGGEQKMCYTHGAHACGICTKDPKAVWSAPINLATFGDKDILVVDSLTQLSESAYNYTTRNYRSKDDEYKGTFDDYRMQGAYMGEVLGRMQASDLNILVLSHEIDVEKDDKKEKIVPVGGTRNFSKTVAKYFDEIVYLSIVNKTHRVASGTTYSPTILTGGRSGVILEDSKEGKTIVDMFQGGTLK